ncbi:Pantothenate transporter [Lachnellula willkommii]|uniref:Pantothenate transporter n=1 Tax=Lachnellula willkommii TaxID=215461 RepID=A0A559MK67_9HELO|nr:Pantothenate transporter [Lachnellula willkommii]
MAKQDASSSIKSDVSPASGASNSNADLVNSKNQVIVSSEAYPQETPKKLSLWRRFLGLFWDSYVADPRERKYIQKVDLHLFVYIMFGYFIKYLDQTNYSNAFVSGMQKDLNLYGNERNYLVTFFNIGIIIGTVPAQMIQMKYVRPSIWIPSCELAWSFFVMAMAGAKDVKTLYALRFCVGFLESCSFPGYATLLGSWFGPTQIGKRMALFENAQGIASMFSGYLQAGLYKGLNNAGGLAGWRWLFIFDAVISIPIALWGFYAIPDLPSNTRARWLTKEDRKYGLERMESFGRAAPTGLTLKAIRRVYFDWHIWTFIFPYLTVAMMNYGSSYFNLWLKAEGYSVVNINTIPTAGAALSIVAALASGIFADRTGKRKTTVSILIITVTVGNILLSVWHLPKGVLMFSNFLLFVGAAAQPIVISWGQEFAQHDAELRQLLVATGNIFTYSFNAFLPVILFPTYDAPHYKFGYQSNIIFGGLAFMGVFLLDFLIKRELSHKESRVTTSGLVVLVTDTNEESSDNNPPREPVATV